MSKKMTKTEMVDVLKTLHNQESNALIESIKETLMQALKHVPDDMPTKDGLYSVKQQDRVRDIIILDGVLFWSELLYVKDNERIHIKWIKRIMKPAGE